MTRAPHEVGEGARCVLRKLRVRSLDELRGLEPGRLVRACGADKRALRELTRLAAVGKRFVEVEV